MKILVCINILLVLLLPGANTASSQQVFSNLSEADKKLYSEHVIGGQPDGTVPVYVRQGYVMRYNEKCRIPQWVFYHITAAYLAGPEREGRFSRFKTDPDVPDPVKDPDYTGSGYARGHMAPFFAMGGDRDNNGRISNSEDDREDPHDDITVYEANYMSNVAPQDQDALNGAGGPWYKLETLIRKTLVGARELDLHVCAGSIVLDPDHFKVLENNKGQTGIAVPEQFFQVLFYKDEVTNQYFTGAFLFPHVTKKTELPSTNLFDYMVTVDEIERITGLDFLNTLTKTEQSKIESKLNKEFWSKK